MAASEVIDLLSSDDDTLGATSRLNPNSKPTIHPTSPPRPGLFYQSDDFESALNLSHSCDTQVSKKQKLSPASKTQFADVNTGIHVTATARNTTRPPSLQPPDVTIARLDEDDPILFTSSVHGDLNGEMLSGKARLSYAEDSDCSLPEDLFAAPGQRVPSFQKSSSMLSERTRAVLGSLSTHESNSRSFHIVGNKSEDDEAADTSTKKSAKHSKRPGLAETGRVTSKERQEAKAQERQQAKEQRAKEKESDLLRKREEKEKKARQKQKDAEIAEVNKAKLDKKDSTPEMIVDFPVSLHGQRVETQTREFLNTLGVEAAMYQSEIPNVVKWRRKVKAKWNSDQGRWEPLSRMQIEDEKHVMCILPAADFISLSTAKQEEEEETLDVHVSKLKTAYPECIPIYLVEGLTKKLRESKNAANRQYQNEVLNHDPSNSNNSGSQPPKRKNNPPAIVDEEVIEDSLLRLQVIHNCLIHHTATHVDTAEWIATFTQHISTIPYKLNRLALTTSTSSCLEPGQVKTGTDATDTYSKILQEIIRITPPIALAIINEYPTLTSLIKAFRDADESDAENGGGALILERLQKATNRNGGFSDRCVGKAISRRVYGVFMGRDPGSTRI